jgi:hypothetical protein
LDDPRGVDSRRESGSVPDAVVDVTGAGGAALDGAAAISSSSRSQQAGSLAIAAGAGVDSHISPGTKDGASRSIYKQFSGVALAGVCLWLAFRGIDLQQLWHSMQTIDWLWIGALFVAVLLSHWLRAMRWTIMLEPLADHRLSLFNSFAAIMYGYVVNIAIPRGGEVARVVAISKSEKIPWVGVVPTLLIDRLLDFALLVCAVGLTMAVLPPGIKEHVGYLVPAGALLCLATLVGLILLPRGADILRTLVKIPALDARLSDKLKKAALAFADQFEQGTQCLKNRAALPSIVLLSFAIWACYFANFYVMLAAFHLVDKINLVRQFIVWTVASLSVIAPTPGCVGTYHVVSSKALTLIGGIDATTSLALVTLLHALSFVVMICLLGGFCFLVQNSVSRRERL